MFFCLLFKIIYLIFSCNYDDKMIEQIGPSRFGIYDLDSNLLCSDKYSVPIYLSSDFCENEVADIIKISK